MTFGLLLSDPPLVCQHKQDEGGFGCACDSGFQLNADGQTCSGIPPDVMILQHPNAGDTITVHAEPGRLFSITCLSSVGVVVWTRPGGVEVPTFTEYKNNSENLRGDLFRERVNSTRESLVAGVSGIQPTAEGEYVCTAENGSATASISVHIEIPDLMQEDIQASSIIRFSTERSLDDIAQTQGIDVDPSSLQPFYDYLNTVALSSIALSEPGYQEFNCISVAVDLPGEMERVECVFNNYNSDLPLDDGLKIENLTSTLLQHNIIAPNSSIIVSDSGFCDENSMTDDMFGEYLWPETLVGETSQLPCNFSGQEESPEARRACVSRGEWSTSPDYAECYTIITMLYLEFDAVEMGRDNIVEVIDGLMLLVAQTQTPADQSQNNFDVVVSVIDISKNIIRNNNITESDSKEIVTDVVQIVDDIQIWPEDIIQQNSSALVECFEELASTSGLTAESGAVTILKVIGDMAAILVELIDINILKDEGRGFNAVSTDDGLFIMSSIIEDDGQIASIALPPSLFERINVVNTSVVIVFTVYVGPVLFPSANGTPPNLEIRSPVIGAQLGGILSIENLTDPVEIFLTLSVDSSNEFVEAAICVSWDFRAAGGRGNWTSHGCTSTLIRGEINTLRCLCNHLTNFAALVDVCSRTEGDCQPDGGTETALEVISYIGVILSIIGLILTIITMVGFKKLRGRDASKFHVQLCLALLGMLLVFVVGIDRTEVFEGCVTVSVLIHYFTLVAVMWMGAEALLMFQKLVIVFVQITTRYIIILSLVCWLAPILPVLISVSIDPRFMVSYREVQSIYIGPNITSQEELQFCFIGEVGVLFGAFLGPIFAVLLFNCVIFVMVIKVLIKHSRKKFGNKKGKTIETTKRLLISTFGIMVLFGLTWAFGALTISDASLAFQFLFAIFNSLQGFFIFLFFCVLGKEARELWLQFLCRGRKIPWITSASTSQPHKGRAPDSSSAVSSQQRSRVTSNTALRSSYLRPPTSTISSEGDDLSIEMNRMTPTTPTLDVIREESEGGEEASYTQESAGLNLGQISRYDLSHSSTIELLKQDVSQPNTSSEIGTQDLGRVGSHSQSEGVLSLTGSLLREQDMALSPSSAVTSGGNSEIIENPYTDHEDCTNN